MYRLAWAKLSTPIIPKMSVSPLESMNNSMPYSTPFNRARGRREGFFGLDPSHRLPAKARVFQVEFHAFGKLGHVHRHEELVVVGADEGSAPGGLDPQPFQGAGGGK